MGENGFDEYKRLYEERFRLNEQHHKDVIQKLEQLNASVEELKLTIKAQTVGWSVLTSVAVILAYIVLPTIFGGCG